MKFRSICLTLYLVVASHVVTASSNDGRSYRRGMTMITPSDQWREAMPSGNGTIGALVYGSISEERVLFNHNELWYRGEISEIPDMSAELPVVRELMLKGKYLEANGHYRKVLQERGFTARNAVYHPAFDMILKTESDRMFEDYSRTVDFETGEVEVTWRDGETRFSRRLFVSIPDDISVMSIKANRLQSVNGEVQLDIHDLKDAIEQNGSPFKPLFTYESFGEDGYLEFRADGSDGGEFGGVLRVVVKNGSVKTENRSGVGSSASKSGVVSFQDADEVILIVGVYANEESSIAVPRLKKKLAAVEGDYEANFQRHAALHSERFNAMSVTLNPEGQNNSSNEHLLLDTYQGPVSPELAQKLFDYGRYLLISSSRRGGYPANLQGIWNGDYRPPWASLYGINENLQMTYWQALPGNMEESMMAFYDYFDGRMDDFRYNAKQLFGCRGIFIPPFMSPESGVMRHTAPHVMHWTDAAGWLASFYNDYYLFTGDEVFLRERAVPFMKEVALFYEDYIVKGPDAKNMFYPSQSPENQPHDKTVIDPKTGRKTIIKVQIDSTIAIAISKEVFSNLIAACELLGVEKEGVLRWKSIFADMPAYEVNEEGALKEWLHSDFKDNYEHRHQSHIYPVFPGHEITEESDPVLYEATKVAIEKRLRIGLKSQTGWSLAHMANVYARLGDGERAMEALNILARCCLGQNFFTYHNDWRKMGVSMDFSWGGSAPFQMDANFGISAAITEMLCGGNSEILRILPALPSKWASGEFQGVLTRVGVKTDASWDMETKEIEISLVAERDTSFDLKFPGQIETLECNVPGLLKESSYGSCYRSIVLKKGDTATIRVSLLFGLFDESI
ncbi:glycoside hydrolase family 95 protein [Puniceicoccaceae bacterium K14]|nr:glycoside hydrolase family 95 protein [Puniceicoccaceae bacterium K14]